MTAPGRPRALLLGDDFGIFLPVARSLGRRGIQVHLVPADDESPGIASRYVHRLHALPPYLAGPAAWAEALRELIAQQDFRLVIPCSDQGAALLEHHADALGRDRLALPNSEAFAAFADKAATRSLAERLGVPVARGHALGVGDAAKLGLPLVLKPTRSYRPGERLDKTPARIVRSPEEREQALAGLDGSWLTEEYFPGEGAGLSVVADQGRILLAAQHRRISTFCETGGSSVRITEAVDPRLLCDVEKLAGEVALTGPAMFEFRRRCDAHILIEVNARFWGSLPLAVAAGADFPSLAWDVWTGTRPESASGYREGVTRTHLSGEFARRAGDFEDSPGLATAARLAMFVASLALPRRFDSWCADDPAPFRAERRQIVKRIAARLLKRLRGREIRAAVPRPAQ